MSLVQRAFDKLAATPGFGPRPDQTQLALLLMDCIESGRRGSFEAPTGLGKSLATLVPALAAAKGLNKRIVIATYTNLLAEQYWRQDLPMAMRLFEDLDGVKTQFLIGKQRYACMAEMRTHGSQFESFLDSVELGTEADYRKWASVQGGKDLLRQWPSLTVPPVCPNRQCSHYDDCYYFSARKKAEKAHIIITNHSVVITDAQVRAASEGEQTLLGNYDYLILDEAHDFASAAQNGLEIEITEAKVEQILGLATKLYELVLPAARKADDSERWVRGFTTFSDRFHRLGMQIRTLVAGYDAALLRVAPDDLRAHPALTARDRPDLAVSAKSVADGLASLTESLLNAYRKVKDLGDNSDMARTYAMYLEEFAFSCRALFTEENNETAQVAYADGGDYRPSRLRRDLVDFSGVLRELVWDRVPWACLSATMTLDGTFEYFERTTGAKPDFAEVLPSPFDYGRQAALYVPPVGRLMDGGEARKAGREEEYWSALAREVSEIIIACEGRTLVLFSSRKEMEAVYERMPKLEGLPVYIQKSSGAAATGDRFKRVISSSLFALRSFWTGFDAPGETCFCVVVVRVPFEPPTDPVALTRMVWLQKQGLDPFLYHTLPQAKMLMRQGTGRLIRRTSDKGIIALLDPRLRTKSYGESIFENLPPGMRVFDEIEEAVAHVGG